MQEIAKEIILRVIVLVITTIVILILLKVYDKMNGTESGHNHAKGGCGCGGTKKTDPMQDASAIGISNTLSLT